MHAAACRSALLQRSVSLRVCRHIAGRRFPTRAFRASRPILHDETPSRDGISDQGNIYHDLSADPSRIQTKAVELEEGKVQAKSSSPERPEPLDGDAESVSPSASASASASASENTIAQTADPARKDKATYGSRRRRAQRNVLQAAEQDAIARVDLSAHNIKLWKRLPEEHGLLKEINGGNASSLPDEQVYPNATVGEGKYQLSRDVLFEIQAAINAGLRPAHERESDSLAAWKAHIILQSPKDGGQAFLDAVVQNVAQRCRADVISLDAQDIASFVADVDPSHSAGHVNGGLATLGYESHVPYSEKGIKDDQYDLQEDDGSQETDFSEPQSSARSAKSAFKGATFLAQPMVVSSVGTDLKDILKTFTGMKTPKGDRSVLASADSMGGGPQAGNDLVVQLIENLIGDAASARETDASATADHSSSDQPPAENRSGAHGYIVHVKDYLEMFASSAGYSMLQSVHQMIMRKRKEGVSVLLIGSSSSEDFMTSTTSEGWRELQNETAGPTRTIVVPCASPDAEDILRIDNEERLLKINVRHLQDMIKRLTPSTDLTDTITRLGGLELSSSAIYTAGFSKDVWSFEHMQRLAHTALGLIGPEEQINADHIEWAINMLDSSDRAKETWLQREKGSSPQASSSPDGTIDEAREVQQERMKKLRKSSNTHEKRLLNGVIDRNNIKTTFSDVHAAPGTIDALRNLTSLSLTRPDAFTYGVLAQEKIPGLLLYGPPGTGKTLLAKAVAKESGATILEVSGADIYDMYVGEGEKNVRAIFSLARKISPCVVFIDEADALFGQRTNSGMRNTHREIVNQFLREWDGMSEHSTFIMVATNRPFDLDEAVLRRLPRRLLVDLPSEADRAKILRIHLTGEGLADDVDLDSLARKTPLYSGSDLKNVCVAAALAAVREETEAAVAAAAVNAGSSVAASQTDQRQSSSASNNLQSLSDSSSISSLPSAPTSSKPPYFTAELSSPTASSTASSAVSSSSPSSSHDQQAHGQPRYPDRRTLRAKHFEMALAEISASVSEDMSTLNAIRKFDERYGDRGSNSNRRRQRQGYGFGVIKEQEREQLETGRVRASASASASSSA